MEIHAKLNVFPQADSRMEYAKKLALESGVQQCQNVAHCNVNNDRPNSQDVHF
jgi:hypothetical protein